MSFADANRASIRVIEESTWGTTPGSGATREVRLTSSSLSAAKETVTSDELRADRMVSAITETSAMSNGDINFEHSAGAQDEFLAAFVMGAWTRPMTRDFFKGATISVTGTSEITIAGKDVSDYLSSGRRILLKGFVDAANNNYFQISAVAFTAGNTVITTVETSLVVEAGTVAARLFDANDAVVLNDATIESTATGFNSVGTPFAAAIAAGQLKVGQKIVVDGLTGVTGTYTITALTSATITTSPAPTAVVAAGADVTVKGSMLRNPSAVTDIIQRKFTIETAYNDIGQYMVQDGMVPGTFSLEVATGAIITGTIGFEGRATQLLQSTILGDAGSYTVLAAQTGEVMNATTNVGEILKDGSTFGASIQSLSISGEANLRQQAAVGSKFSKGIGAGRFNLTGSMTVYFEDETLFNDFLNHETVGLSFGVTDLDGQSIVYTLPAIKFSQDQIAPGGIDQDVFDNVEFTAFRDPNTECMLQVDRFSPNK
ncbi:major tail tube protein [Roseobacter phage DSS3P8]|nr:major tail tube protein [Roseobacter phage DSS3P8]